MFGELRAKTRMHVAKLPRGALGDRSLPLRFAQKTR
jgi:hypothetical protein